MSLENSPVSSDFIPSLVRAFLDFRYYLVIKNSLCYWKSFQSFLLIHTLILKVRLSITFHLRQRMSDVLCKSLTYWIFFVAPQIGRPSRNCILRTSFSVCTWFMNTYEHMPEIICSKIHTKLHLWTLNPIHKVVRLKWGRILPIWTSVTWLIFLQAAEFSDD